MEAFLDNLQAYLIANVQTSAIGSGQPITWILGDPGQGAPNKHPFGFIIPHWDSVAAYASGVDKDTFIAGILVIDGLHKYGPAETNPNVEGGFEQPGYRVQMQYGQAVRKALRAGGAGVTLEGTLATSVVPTIRYVWPMIDKKPYRGAFLALQAQQRRNMTGV